MTQKEMELFKKKCQQETAARVAIAYRNADKKIARTYIRLGLPDEAILYDTSLSLDEISILREEER